MAQPAPHPVLSTADQFTLDELARPRTARSRRVSSANPDLAKNGDARTIQPGETLVLAELDGPGAITHFWNTIGTDDPFAGRSLSLRIYWDGAEQPSVVVPLGDFFGVGHGAAASFSSLPVSVSSAGRARSCFWRMPFAKHAKVTITNDQSTYGSTTFYFYLDWEQLAESEETVPYFHAQYRQAMPAAPGDYVILDTVGRGHYVGTVFSVQQTKTGWFGEGDDRFYLDGEDTPSLRGTGTEDYFGDAWGFRQFATPYYGVSLWEGYFPGDRVTAYRWHLVDPIRFERSLKVAIEHRGSIFTDAGAQTATFAERPDWVSSVAFWYQTPPAALDEKLPPVAERLAPYRVLPAKSLKLRAKPSLIVTKQGDGVAYVPGRGDAEIEFDFDVTEAGRYQINAMLVYSLFGSRYQPYLDGKELGKELDLCHAGLDPFWVGFDLHDLKVGQHTLRFIGRGQSSEHRSKAPSFYAFGMNSLVLLRLEDMAGYK